MQLKKLELMTFVVICLSISSCGTIVPPTVVEKSSSYDSSTPSGFPQDNSGVIGFHYDSRNNVDGAIITDHAKERYNALIDAYRIQFRKLYFVMLNENDGLREFIEEDGSRVWFIDAEHLQYFMRMNRWAKERVPQDTFMQKIGDKI